MPDGARRQTSWARSGHRKKRQAWKRQAWTKSGHRTKRSDRPEAGHGTTRQARGWTWNDRPEAGHRTKRNDKFRAEFGHRTDRRAWTKRIELGHRSNQQAWTESWTSNESTGLDIETTSPANCMLGDFKFRLPNITFVRHREEHHGQVEQFEGNNQDARSLSRAWAFSNAVAVRLLRLHPAGTAFEPKASLSSCV